MRQSTGNYWNLPSLLISGLIAVPMVVVLISLFDFTDPTWQHLRQTTLPLYLNNTLWLMLQVTGYSLLLGVSTAWLTAVTDFPGRRIFSWALLLPLAAPAYIVAYVYTDLLEFSGPIQVLLRDITGWQSSDYNFPQIRSLSGAAIILSLVLYPYVYMLAFAAFQQRSSTLFNAARSLGASPYRAFFKVALPAARPAIAAGLALVLMETLADFGVVDYFAVPTFSTGIFRTWFAMGEKAAAIKLAAMMFIFVIILVLIEKSSRKGDQTNFTGDRQSHLIKLNKGGAAIAFIVCCLPVLLGFAIPFAILLQLAIETGDPKLGRDFSEFTYNSVYVAALTVLFAVICALILSYSKRIAATKATRVTTRIATLGYALPGALLAVALLTPLSMLDRWLADFMDEQFNWRSGLLITGTVAALIYAYVVRFLTVAYNTTDAGLSRIAPVYDHAAKSLGASSWRLLRQIHLPIVKPSILIAAILVFVDTMRELPATLLMRPFNFETLATRVYRLASDERLAEASTAAITIVIIGLIPIVLLHYLSKKKV